MAPRIALCAIAKDEELYIREWITHHRKIGFDEIHIYDNESCDRTAAIIKSEEACRCHHWPNQVGLAPQDPAYNDFLRRFGQGFDWTMHLDIDEFLNLKMDATVAEFVSRYNQADGIAVNWRMFGSSGHVQSDDRDVIERFRQAAPPLFPPNAHVKTIFRPEKVYQASVHSPIFKPEAIFVDTLGRGLPIDGHNILVPDIDLSIAQVNHYFVKSREEFEKKRRRGRADVAIEADGKYRHESEFAAYDRNDDADFTISSRQRTQCV